MEGFVTDSLPDRVCRKNRLLIPANTLPMATIRAFFPTGAGSR